MPARPELPGTGPAAVRPRVPAGAGLPCGPDLARILGPHWPLGLVEILGRGRSSLALRVVREVQDRSQPAAWVDGTDSFCPVTAGVDLPSLTLVRPALIHPVLIHPAHVRPVRIGPPLSGSAQPGAPALAPSLSPPLDPVLAPAPDPPSAPPRGGAPARPPSPATAARQAADLLLRSRAFALVVLDLPRGAGRLADWYRLGRLALRAEALLLLLHGGERPVAGSAAELTLAARLHSSPGPPWGDLPPPTLGLRVLRHRGGPALAPEPVPRASDA